MSYQHERDEFIAAAAREGLDLATCLKLLRYATTLHRLAEAQCNGDWPFNGGRDRPSAKHKPCEGCNSSGFIQHGSATDRPMRTEKCTVCNGSGKVWFRDKEADERHDACYTSCPKCEASGVAKSALSASSEVFATPGSVYADCGERYHAKNSKFKQVVKVCPDCRTQELVEEALWPKGTTTNRTITPIFQGDPRGAVLVLSTPERPWTEDGRGRGLVVPAR